MNELQVFSNPEFGAVRTLLIDNQAWAVGKDVAEALGYAKPTDAIRKHVDDEDKGVSVLETPGGKQQLTIINESGLYSLILSSKLPAAKRFKRWVTSEVLPAIRASGSYQVAGQRPLTTEDYMNAARILAGCKGERLPYVLPLIKRAGINLEILPTPQMIEPREKDPQTAKLLNVALRDYGLSMRKLEQLTGIHTAQLYRMKDGRSRYNAARAELIRDVIHALIPELDISSIVE